MGKRLEMTEVFPVLPARNVSQAIRFYVERLGFQELSKPPAKVGATAARS
jgi:catechol 2,3-dioxygenase-like lactoylglutathione lyase family enzyme